MIVLVWLVATVLVFGLLCLCVPPKAQRRRNLGLPVSTSRNGTS